MRTEKLAGHWFLIHGSIYYVDQQVNLDQLHCVMWTLGARYIEKYSGRVHKRVFRGVEPIDSGTAKKMIIKSELKR